MKNNWFKLSNFALIKIIFTFSNQFKIFIITLIFISSCSTNNDNVAETQWLQNWFSAWELIANEYGLPLEKAPEVLFFDSINLYSTSSISVSDGKTFSGPLYFGNKLDWKIAIHNDSIIIPDGKKAQLQIMTFAAPFDTLGQDCFFVMAAPSYWKQKNVQSDEISLEKFLTGIFLHEFAHTRQMKNIGYRVTSIEKTSKFRFPVSDDLIQDYFNQDSAYVSIFKKEVDLFYKATTFSNKDSIKWYAKQGLKMLELRQKNYLEKEQKELVELDKLFLTMEGLGQFTMVKWLNHKSGGNVHMSVAIKVARRGKNWWSQEEGLALFLILDKLEKINWAQDIFGEHSKNVTDLLAEALQ